MKWAEEVEKGDAGLGQVQGHIRGHDLGQGQGTFKKCFRLWKSQQIENYNLKQIENYTTILCILRVYLWFKLVGRNPYRYKTGISSFYKIDFEWKKNFSRARPI